MAKQTQSASNKRNAGTVTENKSSTGKSIRDVKQESLHTTDDERQRLIAESAYYLAEQRGFHGDMAMDDWLRAEAEVDARLNPSG